MSQKQILIIDDEKDLVEIFSEELTRLGYSTLCAYDGKEGLETALSKRPDVIVSDINMPKMDGLTMLDHLNQAGSKIPVVFFTAFSDTIKIQRAWKLGAFDFLEKPTSVETLEALVKKAIDFGVNVKLQQGIPAENTESSKKSVSVQLKLPEELINKLNDEAVKAQMNFADWVQKKLST